MPKRRVLRKQGLVLVNGPAFLLEVFPNGPRQARMGEVVQAVGLHRQIAPRQLVLSLRPGLNPLQLVLNGKIYRLIIAGFEMQEIMVLARPPIAPIKRLRSNESSGPRQ